MFHGKINERIRLLFFIMIILFIFIFLRVSYIELVDYQKLKDLAEDLWSRNLPITADRGLILDRNGVVLADNITTTSLVLIPNQIKDKELVSISLSKILKVTKEEMDKHVYKKTSIERVHPEGRGLPYDIANQIESLKFDGVYLVKESKRYYPYNNLLSHVLGYVGIDNQGLSGVELLYDNYLMGEDGAIKYFSDAKGKKLALSEVYKAPLSGMNILLTIDYNIQKSLERELNNIVSMFNPDMALAIVMDPNNGEILAMSSRPDYDPNYYLDYSMEKLSRNLPIWASFEPGSTFKIITTAASVEEKIVDLETDTFYDAGSVIVDGRRIGCWKAGGHGHQTFLQVMENSCNPGFVKLGLTLGKERLFSYLDLFGFGEKTGIDLNGEATGIIFPLEKVKNLELATTSFGQGVSVTPIQQITAVSAVVNGGNLYKPFLVKGIAEGQTNSIIKQFQKELVRQTISPDTSATMRYALESVVARGGGRYAYIEDYRVGGKTGTAQKVQDGRYLINNYIMSFLAVVPANKPEAVLFLAIDNPKNTALLSSYTTAPIARRILLDIIEALNIEKQPNAIERVMQWDSEKYAVVPNVINKSVKEANKELFNFEVVYTGSGNRVIEQSPKAGTKLIEGSIVRLLLAD
ncbi:MAG: stage V sporulation protein D [Tenericutes bacterium]|nr:stage V sporulation protein D [Mycoplasmatota bacterium]